MTREYSPWFEHDGAKPEMWLPLSEGWSVIQANIIALDADLIKPSDTTGIYQDFPGFFWRWRTVKTGIFRSERRAICDDPAYAPIRRYRFCRIKPPSVAIARLAEIASDPDLPIVGPEGPMRPPREVKA